MALGLYRVGSGITYNGSIACRHMTPQRSWQSYGTHVADIRSDGRSGSRDEGVWSSSRCSGADSHGTITAVFEYGDVIAALEQDKSGFETLRWG